MRKVLMIVFDWPPRGGVGMLRPLAFAKYLPQYGWEPVIVTPTSAPAQIKCDERLSLGLGVRVIKADYNMFWERFLRFPDERASWCHSAVKKIAAFLKEERVDIIYSTSPPETSHLIAKSVKNKFGIPWVADMRDPWTEYQHKQPHAPIWPRLNTIDVNTMKHADSIVTVSPSLAGYMSMKYKKNVTAITNGFDIIPVGELEPVLSDAGKMRIVYAGKLNKHKQDPSIFFKALTECISDGVIPENGISVDIYTFGQNQPDYSAIAGALIAKGILRILPQVGYQECQVKLGKADLLLFFDWKNNDPVSRGVLPVKMFDYIASGRRILAVTMNETSDAIDILKGVEGADICRSKEEIMSVIKKVFALVPERSTSLLVRDVSKYGRYSRMELTKKLAKVFDETLEKS